MRTDSLTIMKRNPWIAIHGRRGGRRWGDCVYEIPSFSVSASFLLLHLHQFDADEKALMDESISHVKDLVKIVRDTFPELA